MGSVRQFLSRQVNFELYNVVESDQSDILLNFTIYESWIGRSFYFTSRLLEKDMFWLLVPFLLSDIIFTKVWLNRSNQQKSTTK